MDHPIPRPLGLAALITATVTLFSTGAMDQAGQAGQPEAIASQASNEIALSSNAFSPSIVTALQDSAGQVAPRPKHSRTSQLRHSQQTLRNQRAFNKKQLQGHNSHPELPKTLARELPEDIRTARLMLSVESLFKATTAN